MFPLPRKLFLSGCSHWVFPPWVSSGACWISHNGPTLPPTHDRRPNRRRYQQNVCWHRLTLNLFFFLPCKILWNNCFFTGSPILADIPTQFFYGIWIYAPFPHSGSVLCRCPYTERIVRQTTIARTPSHQSVDDCCLALPPRLWQPRYPEMGEATVIEGSLTFPHSCWVSQLDAVYLGRCWREKNVRKTTLHRLTSWKWRLTTAKCQNDVGTMPDSVARFRPLICCRINHRI